MKIISKPVQLSSIILSFATSSAVFPLHAREINPLLYECKQFIIADEKFQDASATVEVENCDRLKRLAQIARLSLPGASPRFYLERIPAGKLPGINIDIPMVRVVFPQRAFFDTANDELRPEARAVVDVIAETLRFDLPDAAVFIAGHTDLRGDRDYNQNLSVDRANAVANALRNSNIPTRTIWRIGFGPDLPLVPNDGPESWGFNRRVEFLIAANEEAVGVWLSDLQLDGICTSQNQNESAKCRRAVNLRSEYQATEVLFGAMQANAAGMKSATGARTTAETTGAVGVKVDVVATPHGPVQVNPIARVKSINLISHTAKEVTLFGVK